MDYRNLLNSLGILFGLISFGLLSASPALSQSSFPSDSMLIFYRRLNINSPCEGPIALGEFVKRTLSWEIKEGENNWSEDALKANAIAARTFTISSYKSDKYLHTDGQFYHCTNAWEQEGFEVRRTDDLTALAAQYPHIFQAVNNTAGIIMAHPDATNREINIETWPSNMRFGAIEASYKRETGWFTAEGGRPWLKEVFDPISSGSPDVGMGQLGSKRWAQGSNDSGLAFPKWDYRRILGHYYSEVDFVGITPDPPNDNRGNIVEVEGIPPNGGLIMCRGEKLPDIKVDFQNVGNSLPVDACPGGTSTLLGYHLYRQDGSIACNNCEGVRSIPLCWSGGGAIPPGKNHISGDLDIFIPDNSAIIKGNTYLLRFDIKRSGVWQGRNANFPWPPQDIPVTICTSGGGSGAPEASVNRPPAVVNYNNLVGGRYGFSWSGRNATGYDLQWRSKEIWESTYPDSWVAQPAFQNMNATVTNFSSPVDCNRDHRDWQFRLRAKNSNQTGDWVIIRSRMRIWPHPWLSYWSISASVLDSDPGPWPRPEDLINYGGGTFNWTVSDNQSWISTNNSGQGIGSLGVVVSKPGGLGDYSATITVNMTNPSPSPFCNTGQPSVVSYNIPVNVSVVDHFEYNYLPIILKNSP